MEDKDRARILAQTKKFFTEVIAKNHISNTRKASSLSDYNINPFLAHYLANFLTGNGNEESIAKVLLYPRILGSSITTSFGQNMQKAIGDIFEGLGSTTAGIDIEFYDSLDGRKKYCQLKAGPRTINKDDINTIVNHFNGVRNLARTNSLNVNINDMIVGVLYGTKNDLSNHYLKIDEQYPVYTGKEFWHRLTGKEDFYFEIIQTIGEAAQEVDASHEVENALKKLTEEIKSKKGKLF